MIDGLDRDTVFIVLALALSGAAVLGLIGLGGGWIADGDGAPTSSLLGDDPDPDELVDEAIAERATTDELTGSKRIEFRRGEDRRMERWNISERPGHALRFEITESTTDDRNVGDVFLENESASFRYDSEANVVERRLRTEVRTVDHTLQDLETLRSEYELTYRGTEELNATTAHVVEAEPVTDAGVENAIQLAVGDAEYELTASAATEPGSDPRERVDSIDRTLWIDTETGYPVKERTNVERANDDEPDAVFEHEYERLDLEEPVEDETFTLDPPADAEIIDRGPERVARYDSRLEAVTAEDLPVPLPEPSVPDEYELTVVVVSEDHGETTVTQWFTNRSLADSSPEIDHQAGPSLYVERSTTGYALTLDDWDETTVRGADGYSGERRGLLFLGWECDDGSIEVGHATDREIVNETSETVACGG